MQNAVLLDNSELRGRQIKVGERGCSGCWFGLGSWIGCRKARTETASYKWRRAARRGSGRGLGERR